MVKMNIIGLGILSLFVSCSKTEYIRIDSGLVYQNRFDTININTESFENKKFIIDSTFAANICKSKMSLIELKGGLKEQLLSEYLRMEDYYSKINDGNDYYKSNSFSEAHHMFYCGRLNLNNKVKSLIFLSSFDSGITAETFQISVINELTVYNFVKNRLCSIVKISNQLENENILNEGLISLKFNNYLLTYNYFTTANNEHYCHYTTFYIDEAGFVRFQWFPFKEISRFFNK